MENGQTLNDFSNAHFSTIAQWKELSFGTGSKLEAFWIDKDTFKLLIRIYKIIF